MMHLYTCQMAICILSWHLPVLQVLQLHVGDNYS